MEKESRLLSAFATSLGKAPADSNEPGESSPRVTGGAGTKGTSGWRGSGRLVDAPTSPEFRTDPRPAAQIQWPMRQNRKEWSLRANQSRTVKGQGIAARVPGQEKAEEPAPSVATATAGNDPSVAGLSRRSPASLLVNG
ncbi:hypothetical protein U0070_019147, partial [Myodes glareolus]